MLIVDNEKLTIERYQKIISVKNDSIKIKCKNYTIVLKGESLLIALLTKDEMIIKGEFHMVEFINEI